MLHYERGMDRYDMAVCPGSYSYLLVQTPPGHSQSYTYYSQEVHTSCYTIGTQSLLCYFTMIISILIFPALFVSDIRESNALHSSCYTCRKCMEHVTFHVHRTCYTLLPHSRIPISIKFNSLSFWLFRHYLSQIVQRVMHYTGQVVHTGSAYKLLLFTCIEHVTLFHSIQIRYS